MATIWIYFPSESPDAAAETRLRTAWTAKTQPRSRRSRGLRGVSGRMAPAMLLALALLGLAAGARAASGAGDSATAQALFDQARSLMQQNRYAEACPKFEESQRLDPALGTSINLAHCWEHLGRTASAWSKFLEVADAALAAGHSEHEQVARARADRLRPRLSKLIISVPRAHRLAELEVRRDGILIGNAQLESPVPLDPGLHRIEARAPGRETWRTEIRLGAESDEKRVAVPLLAPVAASQEQQQDGSWMRPGGLAAAGAGVVAIGVGSYFGLRALDLHDESEAQGCDENDVCEPDALATRQRAITAGNTATVLFIAGGVLLSGGVVLYLFGSSDSSRAGAQVSATLGTRPALTVAGRF